MLLDTHDYMISNDAKSAISRTTFEIFGAPFAALALVVAALALRSRPEPATSPTCTATRAGQKAGTAVLDLT